jgi:uncharacterized spore protein YtfJ
MESIQNMVGAVVDHLGTATTSGAVSGEPIQVGEDVTLVVLSSVTLGMGAGGGEGEGRDKESGPGGGGGEGAGGGAKVRPTAVIAFTKDGVDVLPVPHEPDAFDKIAEHVPDVLEMLEKARETFEGAEA